MQIFCSSRAHFPGNSGKNPGFRQQIFSYEKKRKFQLTGIQEAIKSGKRRRAEIKKSLIFTISDCHFIPKIVKLCFYFYQNKFYHGDICLSSFKNVYILSQIHFFFLLYRQSFFFISPIYVEFGLISGQKCGQLSMI